ncbi:Transposase (or an inactivated derivative) [Quadrisphaera granulorum]|uniref:Mutator family transposase n=1 Tax=Quadrisphaera granulorum TaxID=317664 RepID=A0A316AC47_9ACTN|nr:IS256 family transposase [Quadrisphaera granulorum]PWJ54454.1 transposase-like protein [Quadrisphaera granulorum]SZE96226.1 Transposase (or an inactivated derivative) [Quadrisphaera granulorum]
MTEDHSALLTLLAELHDATENDRIRRITEDALQKLIDAEATATIGAGRYERTEDRTARRNGTRPKTFSTTAGDLNLRIPKLRTGTFYPSLLERRRRIDVALFAVVAEAYVHGVSTRKVDDLVAALGVASGISKSEVSRICADLDTEVAAFRTRPLGEQAYPYVFLDATYCKARVNHRVLSRAVVIATGVTSEGHREVLGVDVGDSEDEAFWKAFLTGLKRRGLGGVQLVISDAHEGLKRAIAKSMSGASWQRCRVHFARNLLAHVAKADGEVVSAAFRTVFAQPSAAGVMSQWDSVASTFASTHPKVAAVMDAAREDVLAFTAFPGCHWKKIWSTNPLERLNKEVKRRTDVVGVFPNDAALLRLTSCVLIEAHDEWAAGDRRYLSEASMAALNGANVTALPQSEIVATNGPVGIDTGAAMSA